MNRLARLVFFAPALLTCTTGSAVAGGGEIMFVNSFEGTGNVPQFVPVDPQAGVVGRPLSIDIDTSEPASQSGVLFSLDASPSGLGIQRNTGLIQWTPGSMQVGTFGVTVRAEDLEGLANTLGFAIEVVDSVSAPLLAPIADQGAPVGELFTLDVEVTRLDLADPPLFSLDQAPAGMMLDPATGALEWLPTSGDLGMQPVVVRATNASGRFDVESFTLAVSENQPPVLQPMPDRGAAPGVLQLIQMSASDPDQFDNLNWQLLQRPPGMSIDAENGLVRWTPTTLQLGPHTVEVRVTDAAGVSDQAAFEILVDHNRAPVAVDDNGGHVELGETLSVPAPGVLGNDSDPNSDPLSTILNTLPQRGSLALAPDGGFEYIPDVPSGTVGLVEKFSLDRPGGANSWLPLIGNLDDDPAAEIFLAEGSGCCSAALIALDGETGAIDWERLFAGREIALGSKPAIGDIDLDGKPELVVIGGYSDFAPTTSMQLYAFEHDGKLKWVSEDLPRVFYVDDIRRVDHTLNESAVTIADIDQDGRPEILAAPSRGPATYHVWDHEGRTLAHVQAPGTAIVSGTQTRVTVVDLDLDGDVEIVVGNAAWSHRGELLWSRQDGFIHSKSQNFPVVANLDDDPYPELIRVRGGASGNLVAWNHDGTNLWEETRPAGFNDAPITVADVDADGYADILFTNPNAADLFEVIDGRDGSVKWSKSVTTRSIGATVFDLDRDGFVEVIFVDESARVHVWDGRDGTEKLVFETGKPRPAAFTVPVFADIDSDGAAELILPGGGSFGIDAAVSVWESPLDDWAPMRAVWNEQRYHVTNVNDDLTIPALERPHWLVPGLNQAMINQRLPEDRLETTDAFTYRASDGELQSNVAEVSIEILPPNAAPRILSTPPLLASPDFEYVYNVLAVDADPGETLVFTVAEGPAAMSVDANGRVTWTPGIGDLGMHPVVISVTDTLGVTAYQNFIVEVRDSVLVPDLGGLTEAAAVAALEAVSLRADPLRDTFSDLVAVGEVALQNPAPSTPIAAGAGVTVEISRGPVPVGVPRLVGLDVDTAIAALTTVGLGGAPIDWVNDPTTPWGIVLSQDPAPNAQVAPASDVAIVVSGGPRAVIDVDPPLIPAGATATVSVSVRDVDGTVLDPQPAVSLSLQVEPDALFGTPPTLNGTTIETSADTQGEFRVAASFTTRGAENVSARVAVAPSISDGPGGTVYTEFAQQLERFGTLIDDLIEAVNLGDGPAIEALDQALADLEGEIDLRRLRTLTPIAPEGGVLPTPAEAVTGGLGTTISDNAYGEIGLDLLVLLEQIDVLVRAGTVPDVVMNVLNQDLAAAASAKASLEPSAVGVLQASPAITAILGTNAPRVLVADIGAVRQALRDGGVIAADGTANAGRFTLPGIMTATRIRNRIIRKVYLPYLGEVARMLGAVIAADVLKTYFNAGSIVGIVTGASQSLHAFQIKPSVIEGFGFNPTLSPNNAVTMIGPSLFEAASNAASGLSGATSAKDVNSVMDAVQATIDDANALEKAWDEANTIPMGVRSGCILDGTPGCRQLIYPDGFASVYDASGLSLPGPVLIIARNLESHGWAVFVANFVPFKEQP